MARPRGKKGHVIEEVEADALSRREAMSNLLLHHHTEVLEQFLPALVAMQETQSQIIHFLSNLQANCAKAPT